MKKKTRYGISIDSDLYREFSQYAKSRGFMVSKLLRFLLHYCIDNDLAKSEVAKENNSNGKDN